MKKLTLNKQTIASLSKNELGHVKGGAADPCWENMWTAYNCTVVYTKPTS